MSRRREVFGGMSARELRAVLAERHELRVAADAIREQLDEARRALYERIGYPLAWILQEGADAHVQADNISESAPHHSSRPRHETERECDPWERVTLRKIIVFARPGGIDFGRS